MSRLSGKVIPVAGAERLFNTLSPGIDERHHMTCRLVDHIQKLSLLRPYREVALLTGVPPRTVQEIAKEFMNFLDGSVSFDTPRVLGLDGVYTGRKERVIVTDLEAGLIVDLWPSATTDEVCNRLRSLPHHKRIQIIVIDMSTTLLKSVNKALPWAIKVVDRFHIQRKANEGMDRVRLRLRKGVQRRRGLPTMCRRELLRKHYDQLEKAERQELQKWFELLPELRVAYEVKEAFFQIWYSSSSRTARARYEKWLNRFPAELRDDFKGLLSAMRDWGQFVFNYFDHRYTNAFTEASNRLVKDVQRETRRCSFQTVRAKVVYGTLLRQHLENIRKEEVVRKKRTSKAHGAHLRGRSKTDASVTLGPRSRTGGVSERRPPSALQMNLF